MNPIQSEQQVSTARSEWGQLLVCPECRSRFSEDHGRLECATCRKEWPIKDGIPVFADRFPYWGEIPKEAMSKVNTLIRDRNWRSVLVESEDPAVRQASEMILNTDRANWHWLTGLGPEARALDLGAGLGANAHGLATRYREVIAMEPVPERVSFMRERFRQEGLRNVRIVQTSLWDIPLPRESCDLIALNGVLEWVATGRPGDPRRLQIEALRNAWELLTPGGYLYIGIENRMPWQYFIGAADVHCGLPYVTVLPRPLATWYARRHGQPQGYRNYIYSHRGYRKLLGHAGFRNVEAYLAVPSYNSPRFYLPLDSTVFSYFQKNFNPLRSGRAAACANWTLERLGLLKYVQNSFAILARKETS